MTKATGTTVPPTITERASEATDDGTLLGLLAEADVNEASFITGRLLAREEAKATDNMTVRVRTMGHVGEALAKLAIKRYDAGLVKGKDGTAVVLSSDDRADLAMRHLRPGLGLTERTDRLTLGDGSVAYTDLQRYWQAARASEDDVARGLNVAQQAGKGENLSVVVAQIARATFERTDPAEAAKAKAKADAAKLAREASKAEAKAEAEALAKVAPSTCPFDVDEAWTIEQVLAGQAVLAARAQHLRTVAKEEAKAEAEANKAIEAFATLAGVTVDVARAMMDEAKAKAEASTDEAKAEA